MSLGDPAGTSDLDAERERLFQAQLRTEMRERELRILAAVATRIHSAEAVEQVLDVCLDEILAGMDLKAAWVFLGEAEAGKLRLAASRGVAAEYLEEIRVEGLSDCLCPEVFRSGNRMQARNTTQCPRMPTIVEGLRAPVAHACIPLQLHGGATLGVLNVAARPGQEFTEEELSFLETLGHQLCVGVERAEHRLGEQVRNQEARALAAIHKAIGGSLDVEAVLDAVGQSAREVLSADRVQILLGEDPRRMRVAQISGTVHPELQEGQTIDLVALGARMQRRALEEHRVFTIGDWATDERVNRELARRWGIGSATIVPLVARGRALGLLVVVRGETRPFSREQVELAEALAAQASVAIENARLYEQVRRAYEDLKEAQQRLVQNERMALLGTFASGLAHEVRNPLNSIALQLALLERRIAGFEVQVADPLTDLVGVIREEIRRLDALVGDFLLFSRTSRIQRHLADLEVLIDETTRLLRPEARAAGVTLRRQRLPVPVGSLRIDAEKIKQVIINLVRNAIEAMPEGGLIEIESGLVSGQAQIVVRDNGPGLPEGVDVYQLFVTTKVKGTGLGLSLAQQIVLAHGGEIDAASVPGEGATFTVRLPRVHGDSEERPGDSHGD